MRYKIELGSELTDVCGITNYKVMIYIYRFIVCFFATFTYSIVKKINFIADQLMARMLVFLTFNLTYLTDEKREKIKLNLFYRRKKRKSIKKKTQSPPY